MLPFENIKCSLQSVYKHLIPVFKVVISALSYAWSAIKQFKLISLLGSSLC